MEKEISETCKKCKSNELCTYYIKMKKLVSDERKENFVKKLKKQKKNFIFEISLIF